MWVSVGALSPERQACRQKQTREAQVSPAPPLGPAASPPSLLPRRRLGNAAPASCESLQLLEALSAIFLPAGPKCLRPPPGEEEEEEGGAYLPR